VILSLDPKRGELIDMKVHKTEEEMFPLEGNSEKAADLIDQPVHETRISGPKPTKKIVSNEEFIRAWNGAEYLSEAADAMGIQPESARARGAKLRKTFAKAGVNLILKGHKRKPRSDRAGLADNTAELARLAQIASDTYEASQTNESENIEPAESQE